MSIVDKEGLSHCAIKWLGAIAIAIAFGSLPVYSQSETTNFSKSQIESWLEQVLSEQGDDPQQLLTTALRAQAAIEQLDERDLNLEAKACLAVAMSRFYAQSPIESSAFFDTCYVDAVAASQGTLRLRLDRFRAILLAASGQLDQSLSHFEEILARDHTNSDPEVMLRIRSNYAMMLSRAGRSLAAIEAMQNVFEEALELDARPVLIMTGNNLVHMMIEQDMVEAATALHKRIMPLISSDADPIVVKAVNLNRVNLQILNGEAGLAADWLEGALSGTIDVSPVFSSTTYALLADAYRQLGRMDDALEAAEKAVDLLADKASNSHNERLALVRVLLAIEDYSRGLDVLDQLESDGELTQRMQEKTRDLRIRALLGQNDSSQVLAEFERFVAIGRDRSRESAELDLRYFETARLAQRQREEIQRIEQATVLLEAEALASEARARESLAVASGARKARNLLIAFFAALLVLLGMLFYIVDRRRQAIAQSVRNERLEREVDEKSAALVANMAEQAELERAMAQKEHTQAIGSLTGNVAHDFNNLLQVISIANEQLEKLAMNKDQRSLLQSSQRALSHGRNLIRQLLAYARRQSLEIESVKFSSYLEKTRTLLSAAVDDQIEFKIEDQSAGASAMVDASLLTTALLNLLSNSIDAIDGPGNITVRARLNRIDDFPDKRWPTLPLGEYLVVSVEDDGKGLTPDVLARAREPFFTNKEAGAGSGLGLSSAQGFARQCGGDLAIVSEPGVFTRVSIALPSTTSPEESAVKEQDDTTDLTGVSILLVEDNPELARTLNAMLQQLGARVDVVDTADRALKRLEALSDCDMLLSDLRIKGETDGYGLYRQARRLRPDLPVLLMTGSSSENTNTTVPILHKPFTQKEMVLAMDRAREGVATVD